MTDGERTPEQRAPSHLPTVDQAARRAARQQRKAAQREQRARAKKPPGRK